MKEILIVDEEFPSHETEMEILSEQLPQFNIRETNYRLESLDDEVLSNTVGVLSQIYTTIDADFINKMPNLKYISIYGGGYDRVDFKYTTGKGIKISRVPDYCNDEVAEFVIMSILMFSKKIDEARKSFYGHAWGYESLEKRLKYSQKSDRSSVELPRRVSGKTLFIVGYGKIGKSVAKKAEGLGMKVLFYDNQVYDTEEDATRVSLQDGLQEADFVSIHTPLTEETRGLFDYSILSKMKRTSYLINTARGAIVREGDLIKALDNRIIAGAALDVFEKEPVAVSNRLLKMKTVIATPHCTYITDESMRALKTQAAENLIQMIMGLEPAGMVKS